MRRLLFIALLVVAALLVSANAPSAHAQDFRSPELNVQFHRAHTAWSTGNSLLEAKARIDRVLNDRPNDVEALKLRAAILMDMQRPEEAFQDAHRATRLTPEDGEAHLLRCESAAQIGQEYAASEALEQASNLFLERIDHYVRLSSCALEIGAGTRAESLARVAVAQDNTDPRGHVQLARVFLASDEPDEARAIVNRLIEANSLSRLAVMADSQLASLYLDVPLDQE
ncbi:MAG: tetratricopeptide repeat protein [Rhodothermales bacterium]